MAEEDAWDVQAVLLAERFGWQLDYIADMPVEQFERVLTTLDAIDKVRAHRRRQEKG